MTETPKPKKKFGALKKLVKIVLIVFCLGFVSLTILSKLGGSGEYYKEFIESFLSEVSGYAAHVEKVNEVEFFPDIVFDFENAAFYQKEGEDIPIAGLGRFRVVRSFWATVFNWDSWKALELEKAYADPGAFINQGFRIDHAGLIKKEDSDKGLFELSGRIGQNTPVKAEIEIVKKTKGQTTYFSLEGEDLFSFKLGKAELRGDSLKEKGGKRFKDLQLIFDGQNVFTGNVLLKNGVTGELTLAENNSVLHPDIEINLGKGGLSLSGQVESPLLNISDISGSSRLISAVDYIGGLFAGKNKKETLDLSSPHLDLGFDIGKLMAGKTELGQIKAYTTMKDNVLTIKSKGAVASGQLDGTIEVKAIDSPAELTADLKITNMNYGSLQGAMEGGGNAVIDLQATGTSWQDLKKNLSGKIDFVGGKGEFTSGAANFWGRGLVNAILPDISQNDSLAINCAIIDFSVENGLATSNALFVDGQHVTVAGKGSYDIAEDKLDISLKPKSKSIALGSVSSAVKVTGSFGKPSFSPDMIDFGTTIGGMLLGVINPAFLALSLTDLGLSEDHPCAKYIKESPAAAE